MGSRLLSAAVALAAALSAGLLGVMLAAPLLPQPGAVTPAASSTPVPSHSPDAQLPPMGLYVTHERFVNGQCLALDLGPHSYPVAAGAIGDATIMWWQRGVNGCGERSGEVGTSAATVEAVRDEDRPDGPTIGYRLAFVLPALEGFDPTAEPPTMSVALTILAGVSTQTVVQAVLEQPSSGEGYAFDLVAAVEPPLNPLPSSTPVALQPDGLYLLRGPFGSDGPCLVLELGEASYPLDTTSAGTATIRWWERAVADPGNPAECLTRAGEVSEVPASVVAVADAGGTLVAYTITFSVPVPATGSPQDVEISLLVGESTQDQLRATVFRPDGIPSLVLDRVDSIDPPLGP